MGKKIGNLVLEDARIMFKNFSGREEKFNPAGRKNFCVVIPDDIFDELIEDGWNVRRLSSRDDPDDTIGYLQVAVNFDNIPPKVVMITSKGKVVLDDDTISQLDHADISNVDLVIRPYVWNVNDKTGVKAYLKTLYVTLNEDEFERKYADISDENDLPF